MEDGRSDSAGARVEWVLHPIASSACTIGTNTATFGCAFERRCNVLTHVATAWSVLHAIRFGVERAQALRDRCFDASVAALRRTRVLALTAADWLLSKALAHARASPSIIAIGTEQGQLQLYDLATAQATLHACRWRARARALPRRVLHGVRCTLVGSCRALAQARVLPLVAVRCTLAVLM